MKDLSQFTDEELRAERRRRDKERDDKLLAEKMAKEEKLCKLVQDPAILEFIKLTTLDHSRTSCDDEHLANEGRCGRCTVLYKVQNLDGLTDLRLTTNDT